MKKASRRPAARLAHPVADSIAHAVRRAVFDAILHACDDGWADDEVLTVEPAPQPMGPALLAAAHGEAEQPKMRTLYEGCLHHYRGVVGDGPGDRDDVVAAVAHFVAANMQALHGLTVTPAMLLALHRQLGGVARLSSRWDQASVRERQVFFEKMAIVAVLVDQTWTLAQSLGPTSMANVQRGARNYLRELFGFDPDRLLLSDDGLGLAPAAVAA
jgi:hypothetical protein